MKKIDKIKILENRITRLEIARDELIKSIQIIYEILDKIRQK